MPNKNKKISRQLSKRSSNRSAFFPAVIIAIIIVLGGAGFFLVKHYRNHTTTIASTQSDTVRPTNSVSYAPSQPSDNAANNQRKSTAGSTTGTTLNTPATTPNFSATISRANGSSQSQSITVAANVNGVTSGTCIFNFAQSQNGAVVTSSPTEQIQETNQSAACPPVTVAMPSAGSWYVSVSVTNNGSTATAEWAANPVEL